MATQREQRIKLRCDGSPVKLDATIIESTPDAKCIKVRFDGPLEDTVLRACGDTTMFSDAKDRDGKPVDEYRLAATCRLWHVL